MPTDMQQAPTLSDEQVKIIKLHKRWADRLTFIWLGFALLMLSGFQFVLDHFGIAAAERTDVVLLVAVLILIAAVWQAVGLGIARVHMLVNGIDLTQSR
jgi:hypothetical protein